MLKPYICPKCGATQKPSLMPAWNPWMVYYTFRCQSCATMLRLYNSRWAPVIALALIPFATISVEILLSIEIAKPSSYIVPYLQWRRIVIWIAAIFGVIMSYFQYRQGPRLAVYSDE